MKNTKLLLTATGIVALSIFIGLNNTAHLYFTPPRVPGSHDNLHVADIIQVTGASGPESLAFDPSGGGPYAGVADGRILKWHVHNRTWVDFAVTTSRRKSVMMLSPSIGGFSIHDNKTRTMGVIYNPDHPDKPLPLYPTRRSSKFKPQLVQAKPEMEHVCGRPLGLKFDKRNGDLYIADAYFGLQVVGPDGGLAVQVVPEVEGRRLLFTNDMDIDEVKGVIYFTDTSTSFHRRQFMSSILSGDKTGRLIRYEMSSKEVTILLKDLAFANGVALSKDRSFLLVAETTSCRILKIWLEGPNVGKPEVFADLPGFPDNVRSNPKGEFWVALHSKKSTFSHWLVSNPWVGKVLLKLPFSFKQFHYLLVGGKPHATAVRLSEKGDILEVLEDSEGKGLRFISEVEEKNGKLWIGSVMMPFVGVYDLHY